MGAVYFYHMTRSAVTDTLPVLLEKSLAAGWRVLVRGGSDAGLAQLDEALWRHPNDGFLPHGLSGGAQDADQPVLLTRDAPLAGRAALVAVHGAEIAPSELPDVERAMILFDGNDEAALTHARAQWRLFRDAGSVAKYWSEESGTWEMKAETG